MLLFGFITISCIVVGYILGFNDGFNYAKEKSCQNKL